MKNIHIFPTSKPSRLFEILKFNFVFDNQNKYSEEYKKIHKYKNQNIYITNHEEIKEGDWFYNIISLKPEPFKACENGNGYVNCNKYSHNRIDCKKIILTTDQDLIKNGVQAINDEFLEWFVKNPSCEFVKVETKITKDGVWTALKGYVELPTIHSIKYKIIIPKGEPKQEMSARLQNSLTQFNLYIEEALELEDWKLKTIGFSNKSIIELRNLTPKQETLGEARKYAELSYYGDEIDAFVSGVKWKQEQDKKMYSEEEIFNLLEQTMLGSFFISNRKDLVEWFEQFKKK